MLGFPNELSAALKPAIWSGRTTVPPIASGKHNRLRWFPLALRQAQVKEGLEQLERTLSPFLRPVRGPVNPTTITGMKRNFSEALPKTLRNWSVSLNGSHTPAYDAAYKIGLIDLLKSASLREFATCVSGFQLTGQPGMQVIRYQQGDYVGPHNDHHPEEAHLRDGYVDLQITLTNSGVARQYLLYESGGYFNNLCNVGVESGLSVSMLPFWHQVTPLEVKAGREQDGHRWLLLASFEIAQPPQAKKKKARISPGLQPGLCRNIN
jgi:hypothetical protein